MTASAGGSVPGFPIWPHIYFHFGFGIGRYGGHNHPSTARKCRGLYHLRIVGPCWGLQSTSLDFVDQDGFQEISMVFPGFTHLGDESTESIHYSLVTRAIKLPKKRSWGASGLRCGYQRFRPAWRKLTRIDWENQFSRNPFNIQPTWKESILGPYSRGFVDYWWSTAMQR